MLDRVHENFYFFFNDVVVKLFQRMFIIACWWCIFCSGALENFLFQCSTPVLCVVAVLIVLIIPGENFLSFGVMVTHFGLYPGQCEALWDLSSLLDRQPLEGGWHSSSMTFTLYRARVGTC